MQATRIATLLAVGLALLGVGFALGRGSAGHWREPTPHTDAPLAAPQAGSPAAQALARGEPADSLVYLPFDSLTNESPEGIAAARLLVEFLDRGDRSAAERALAAYERLHAVENFGGEYPTLQWFCEYALADEAVRATLLEDADGRRFVELFGANDWTLFRRYLLAKYGLASMKPSQLRYLDELVRFNSPYRARWERTERVLELLALEPGMHVADVGAGGGYFSFRMAASVGPAGVVHAVETNRMHLEYLGFVAATEGLDNLRITPTDGSFPDLPAGSLDRVFLCSTYQAIYLSFREDERRAWIAALLRSLAPGGLVVVSENEPVVDPEVVPYRGISVSRPLIEGQLMAHGLELVREEQLVPQRYLLVMRKAAP